MTVNRGKDFEEVVRDGFKSVSNTSVIRLPDPMAGYAGVKNICDFIVYNYPYQYLIECKSVHGNTLPFSNITDNQWKGMLEMSAHKGVVAGVMCWFNDHDKTVFIPIQCLEVYKQSGYKSINVKDLDSPPFVTDIIEVPGKKKRIMFDYDMAKFFDIMRIYVQR